MEIINVPRFVGVGVILLAVYLRAMIVKETKRSLELAENESMYRVNTIFPRL